MNRWAGKVAVITGAASGIGAAIAEQLVKEEVVVVGLDVQKDLLDKLVEKLKNSKGMIFGKRVDITKESEVIESFAWIKNNLGPVHILVNSAGIIRYNTLLEGVAQKWKDVLDVNVFGLCLVTREAVNDMLTNSVNGHVININSVSGHTIPENVKTSAYGASKFAVTALTETLKQELISKKSKIKVTSISPSIVKTNILNSAGYDSETVEAIFNLPHIYPEDLANAVLYVLATPPHVEVRQLTIRAVERLTANELSTLCVTTKQDQTH